MQSDEGLYGSINYMSWTATRALDDGNENTRGGAFSQTPRRDGRMDLRPGSIGIIRV